MRLPRWLAVTLVCLFVLSLLLIVPWFGEIRSSLYQTPSSHQGPMPFPTKFFWGTATADQQIEHQQPSDWTAFEQRVVREKKFSAKAPGDVTPGHIAHLDRVSDEIRRKKTDHDRLFAQDFDLAAKMGHNSYRFSISWSRLFPTAAHKEADPAGVKFYQAIFDALKARKLEPFVTLFHFASPAWLWEVKDGKRGWERADAVDHFLRFTDAVLKHFGPQIRYFCTLNEPVVYLYQGYLEGFFPPNEKRKDPARINEAIVALLKAHAGAYHRIHAHAKAHKKEAYVGIAKHFRSFEPYRNLHPLDRITAKIVAQTFLWDFPDAIHTGVWKSTPSGYKAEIPGLKGTSDYFGVNYYGRYYIRSDLFRPTKFDVLQNDPADPKEKKNDLGWALYPHGFFRILAESKKRYNLPIFVLENGTADARKNDTIRQEVLTTHLREIWLANHLAKADVRGYFHWSLIDNFEWAEGFEARFGLIAVEYQNNFLRVPRPSASLFSSIIKANALPASP